MWRKARDWVRTSYTHRGAFLLQANKKSRNKEDYMKSLWRSSTLDGGVLSRGLRPRSREINKYLADIQAPHQGHFMNYWSLQRFCWDVGRLASHFSGREESISAHPAPTPSWHGEFLACSRQMPAGWGWGGRGRRTASGTQVSGFGGGGGPDAGIKAQQAPVCRPAPSHQNITGLA